MSVRQDQDRNNVPILIKPLLTSEFTFNDLTTLNDPKTAYLSPLAVISLIDMNAFFAQVEQIRLDLTAEDPVVCVQWLSLIAVSYAARKFGISRMDTVKAAKSKCPNVILAHAAVFKKGESNWSYLNYIPSQGNYKVSLDPYRRESRKIIRLFHQFCDLVEKASVDECYLDFGRLVYKKLIHYFPFLEEGTGGDKLPPIPSELPESIQWKGEVVCSANEDTPVIKDWDDICMMIGSQILFELRVAVYNSLGYTTSGGLARNKILAKVAGGFKKPDNQTIIRTSLIEVFLLNFSLNDFSGMGGKIGESILRTFDIPSDINSISFIRDNYTLSGIESKLNYDLSLSLKLYNIVRGNVKQELVNRMDVKSMMSAKNFTITFNKLGDAFDWIRVFVGDLYNRLIELDEENLNLSELENSSDPVIIRPKTISIHMTTLTNVKYSKQTQVPITKSLETLKEILETLACKLFIDLLDDNTNLEAKHNGRKIRDLDEKDLRNHTIISLRLMTLTISNFVRQKDSNLIDTYLNKGNADTLLIDRGVSSEKNKANKIPDKEYLKRLFAEYEKDSTTRKQESPTLVPDENIKQKKKEDIKKNRDYILELFEKYNDENNLENKVQVHGNTEDRIISLHSPSLLLVKSRNSTKKSSLLDELLELKFCPECNSPVDDAIEHNDYHVALKLSQLLNGSEDKRARKDRNIDQPLKKLKTGKKQWTLPF